MSEVLKNVIESIKIEALKLEVPHSHYQVFELSERLKHIIKVADVGIDEMNETLAK